MGDDNKVDLRTGIHAFWPVNGHASHDPSDTLELRRDQSAALMPPVQTAPESAEPNTIIFDAQFDDTNAASAAAEPPSSKEQADSSDFLLNAAEQHTPGTQEAENKFENGPSSQQSTPSDVSATNEAPPTVHDEEADTTSSREESLDTSFEPAAGTFDGASDTAGIATVQDATATANVGGMHSANGSQTTPEPGHMGAMSSDTEPGSPFIDWSLDETRLQEQQMTLNLVPSDMVTHRAVQSGSWFDPNTWETGEVPGAGARVQIPLDTQVTYDGQSTAPLLTVRVDGELKFSNAVNTKMVVDTFVVTHPGRLEIAPNKDVTTDVVFQDHDGPISDMMSMGLGLVTLGSVSIQGTEKTSHTKVGVDAYQGDTSLVLSEIPVNWEVGDTIVLTGTTALDFEMREHQDEVRTITAIEGNVVHFDGPLQFDHVGPQDGLFASVANMSRNVTFSSADPDTIANRGHVMFMHNDDVDVRYAEFDELGRTDKSRLDVGSMENPNGRYAFHFHKQGVELDDDPSMAIGNAVTGSPGWGFVHHSSYSIFDNNAAYGVAGAAFVAESGDETGSWGGNIAIGGIGIEGSADSPKAAVLTANTGNGGVGFYFQGRLVHNHDNIAASQSSHGFLYFHRTVTSLKNPTPGTFDDILAEGYMVGDSNDLETDRPPIQGFAGNEAFAVGTGFEVIKNIAHQHHGDRSVFEDFLAWNVQEGVLFDYTGHYLLRDSLVISRADTGEHIGPDRSWDSTGLQGGNWAVDTVFDNVEVIGFHDAIKTSSVGSLDSGSFIVTRLTATDVVNRINNRSDVSDFVIELDMSSVDLSQTPTLIFDADADLTIDSISGNEYLDLSGTFTDSLGTSDYQINTDHATRRHYYEVDLRQMIRENGFYDAADGSTVTLYRELLSDRWTGDTFVMDIVITIADPTILDTIYDAEGHPISQTGFKGVLDTTELGGFLYTNSGAYAQTDYVKVDEGKSIVFDVFANDSDLDGDAISLVGFTGVENGTLTHLGNGQFSYTPNLGFVGRDDFTYTIVDAGSGRQTQGRVYVDTKDVVGDEYLTGGSGSDVIDGGVGNDALLGFEGNDVLDGGSGSDILQGGNGIDWLFGRDGADTLDGGEETDALFGGDGDDNLTGGAGGDSLDGGYGDDVINGNGGIDWLYGSFGDDELIGGADTDALFGQEGNDTLRGGDAGDSVDGGADDDQLFGDAGVDWLYGQSGNDSLDGGDDGDVLFGGAGNDTLSGGAGNDSLDGGDGDDVLNGGAGVDIHWGGLGADSFVFSSPSDGGDVVRDFVSGIDTIVINQTGFGLGASGPLSSEMFESGDGLPAGFTASGPVFYLETVGGGLWFDPTGGSSSDVVIVAGFETGRPDFSDIIIA